MSLTPEDGDPILNHFERHIPGAYYVDLRYFKDLASPYPNMLPSVEYFKDYMKRLGIKTTSKVVVYDDKT